MMSATLTTHPQPTPQAVAEVSSGLPGRSPRTLVDRLCCPVTGQTLTASPNGESLVSAESQYPVRDGVPLLLEGTALERARSWTPAGRHSFRQRIRAAWPAPVSARRQKRYLAEFLDSRKPGDLTINVGSGSWDLGPDVVNLDALPYPSVDLCCDVHRLPFGSAEVDAVVCTGALEHVADPVAVVAEFYRVLRPGGAVFCTVPFMQAYHEDPEDYRRYTSIGLRQLFRDFSDVRVRPSHGAGSALAWVAADALAAALALNNGKLHTAWLMMWRCLFAPLRVLDRLSEGSRFESIVCSALLVEAVR